MSRWNPLTPPPVVTAEEQGLRLRISAEQAVIAEGYDVGDARGRPVQICRPAWVGRWERLFSDDLATEDTEAWPHDTEALPHAWADELAKLLPGVSMQVVLESLPSEMQASVRSARLRAQCKREQDEKAAVARLRDTVPWGR